MPHLVIGDAASFLRAEHAALLLQSGDDAFDRHSEVVERDRVAVAPRRYDSGFIDQVGEVGASEARSEPCDLIEIDVCGKPYLGGMYLQNFAPPGAVGAIDQHLAVEPSRAQQGGIKYLWTIGGGEQNHPRGRIEAIELGKELVERLLLLVVAAERAGHAAAPQRIEFVDEND